MRLRPVLRPRPEKHELSTTVETDRDRRRSAGNVLFAPSPARSVEVLVPVSDDDTRVSFIFIDPPRTQSLCGAAMAMRPGSTGATRYGAQSTSGFRSTRTQASQPPAGRVSRSQSALRGLALFVANSPISNAAVLMNLKEAVVENIEPQRRHDAIVLVKRSALDGKLHRPGELSKFVLYLSRVLGAHPEELLLGGC